MNDKLPHNLLKEFGHASATRLPLHQQALKQRLLTEHARQQTFAFRLRTFVHLITGVLRTMKAKNTALGALGVGLMVIGVITFTSLTSQPVSALDVVNKAADKVEHMLAAKIEEKNKLYQQNLKERLAEAKKAPSLRLIEVNELNAWGVRIKVEDPNVKHYLTFNDIHNDRIVIGVNASGEPVLVYNVEDILAPNPAVEVNDPSASVPTGPGQSVAPVEGSR